MKIKSDAWHYKYVASKWDNRPEGLCWYFWKVVLSVLMYVVGGVVFTVLGLSALYLLAVPITSWFMDVSFTGQLISAVAWLVIWGTVQYQYRQYLYDTRRLKMTIPEYKEPGLLRQFIQAKHRKVCPLLEYERRW